MSFIKFKNKDLIPKAKIGYSVGYSAELSFCGCFLDFAIIFDGLKKVFKCCFEDYTEFLESIKSEYYSILEDFITLKGNKFIHYVMSDGIHYLTKVPMNVTNVE